MLCFANREAVREIPVVIPLDQLLIGRASTQYDARSHGLMPHRVLLRKLTSVEEAVVSLDRHTCASDAANQHLRLG